MLYLLRIQQLSDIDLDILNLIKHLKNPFFNTIYAIQDALNAIHSIYKINLRKEISDSLEGLPRLLDVYVQALFVGRSRESEGIYWIVPVIKDFFGIIYTISIVFVLS